MAHKDSPLWLKGAVFLPYQLADIVASVLSRWYPTTSGMNPRFARGHTLAKGHVAPPRVSVLRRVFIGYQRPSGTTSERSRWGIYPPPSLLVTRVPRGKAFR